MQLETQRSMREEKLSKDEYGAFYQSYIDSSGQYELIDGLKANLKTSLQLFQMVPFDKQEFRYASGKWTIKELIQHIIDSERIFNYRALRFARNDFTELSGYDHNQYVPQSNANRRKLIQLIKEFELVRESTIMQFDSFDDDILVRKGIANKETVSVRALGYIITGHCSHHCQIIRNRYL